MLAMRSKIARALRKWADLIDPRHGPSDVLSIRIEIDSKEAEDKIEKLKSSCEELNSLIPKYLINRE